jgi:NAD(P)H dehydrogenase (quinone)
MILITGATGHIGGAVIRQLLTRMPASRIAALARDPAKASHLTAAGVDVRIGDYSDVSSLDRAMRGIGKVLLVSGGGGQDGLQQHRNVVDAAKRAGVQCISYTSRSLKDRTDLTNTLMERHFQTEDYIRESGLGYILFRNALYMDVLPLYLGDTAIQDGAFHLPFSEGRTAYALREELGEAIANVLAEEGCGDRVYTFTGGSTYSFADVSRSLSELAEKDVRYVGLSQEDYIAFMEKRGKPAFVSQFISAFVADINKGQESVVTDELAEKLGRKPAGLREGLQRLFGL